MFCQACGNDVAVGEKFCRVCGNDVSAPSAPRPALVLPAEGTIFPAQTSVKAIASLACSLFLFAFPLSILAIIFGHIAVSEIRTSAGRLKGEGIAITGLILGYVGLAIIPVILVIAAIVIPYLRRGVMAANESSAIASVRQIVSAEIGYSSSHPEAGYTCRLSDLAKAGLIDAKLASGQKNGYVFDLSGCRAGAIGGVNQKYLVVAYPIVPDRTGAESFCSDETGIVKTDVTGSRLHCMINGFAQR